MTDSPNNEPSAADGEEATELAEGQSARTARGDTKDRLATLQKKQRRDRRRGGLMISTVAGVVILGLVGGGWYLIHREQTESGSGVRTEAGTTVGQEKSYDNLTNEHITQTNKTYPQNPPVGGDHNPAWANCGIYDKEIPNIHAVHSLEHGAVWITYQPGLAPAQVRTLKGLAKQNAAYMLMSQDKSQPAPIALTSWGRQIFLDKADDPKAQKFIKDNLMNPRVPELGASCAGAYDPNTGQLQGGM